MLFCYFKKNMLWFYKKRIQNVFKLKIPESESWTEKCNFYNECVTLLICFKIYYKLKCPAIMKKLTMLITFIFVQSDNYCRRERWTAVFWPNKSISLSKKNLFYPVSGLFVSEAAGILHVWSYFFTKTSNEWHEASTTTALPPTIEPNNL